MATIHYFQRFSGDVKTHEVDFLDYTSREAIGTFMRKAMEESRALGRKDILVPNDFSLILKEGDTIANTGSFLDGMKVGDYIWYTALTFEEARNELRLDIPPIKVKIPECTGRMTYYKHWKNASLLHLDFPLDFMNDSYTVGVRVPGRYDRQHPRDHIDVGGYRRISQNMERAFEFYESLVSNYRGRVRYMLETYQKSRLTIEGIDHLYQQHKEKTIKEEKENGTV